MFSMKPIELFDWSFGGSAVIFVNVSRIETRDGVIQLPVSLTSQKRRFCICVSIPQVETSGKTMTYLLIINDNPLPVVDVRTEGCSEPPLPENAINPREAHLFPECVFCDANGHTFRLS